MPFTPSPKSAGDLIRSQDWNAALTAIAQLFDKLNGTTGHAHTGAAEDGPQITTAGLMDAAVTLQKLADLAVSTAKLQNGAVTNQKLAASSVANTNIINGAVDSTKIASGGVANANIANGAVDALKIANLAVGTNQLANLGVTAAKIATGTITQDKLASGVGQPIAIAISSLQHGQSAPIPSGFLLSECQFYIAFKYLYVEPGQGNTIYNCSVNSSGVVTVSPSGNAMVRVLTLARKGGW